MRLFTSLRKCIQLNKSATLKSFFVLLQLKQTINFNFSTKSSQSKKKIEKVKKSAKFPNHKLFYPFRWVASIWIQGFIHKYLFLFQHATEQLENLNQTDSSSQLFQLFFFFSYTLVASFYSFSFDTFFFLSPEFSTHSTIIVLLILNCFTSLKQKQC